MYWRDNLPQKGDSVKDRYFFNIYLLSEAIRLQFGEIYCSLRIGEIVYHRKAIRLKTGTFFNIYLLSEAIRSPVEQCLLCVRSILGSIPVDV